MMTALSPRAQKIADRKASAARIAAAQAEARIVVAGGTCPTCGAALKRNLSIAGWYQCSQLGAVTHRADPSKPSCNFQCFTE